MKKNEQTYAFRCELDEVHRPDRRNPALKPEINETCVDDAWCIVLPENADALTEYAATDLQDYFRVSMNVNLPLRKSASDKAVVLEIDSNSGKKARSFLLEVSETQIRITGSDAAGVPAGCFYLEDVMNLREAPFVPHEKQWHERLHSPRMVHSGWGLDQFPDSHLNAIAHEGFDSVLLFVKGPGRTTHGFMDFNDLIARCAK